MEKLLTYNKVEGECAEFLKKFFTSEFRSGYVQCKGFVLPQNFQIFGDQIQSMEVRPDDIWLCSVPKSGTTWAQEAVWCIANNVDLEAAKERQLSERFPFLERTALHDNLKQHAMNGGAQLSEEKINSVNFVNKLPSPRFIKSHLPLVLLPTQLQRNETNAKIVYIVRNPRDACISFYHHSRYIGSYTGDFEMFCDLFLRGAVHYLPYWDHVLSFWRMRNRPNVLFLVFEEMKRDLRGSILKIAEFLGKKPDEDQVRNLKHHISFDYMKQNPMVNKELAFKILRERVMRNTNSQDTFTFMRCGQAGQWRDVMGEPMVERFHKWEQENLKDIADYPLQLDT